MKIIIAYTNKMHINCPLLGNNSKNFEFKFTPTEFSSSLLFVAESHLKQKKKKLLKHKVYWMSTGHFLLSLY